MMVFPGFLESWQIDQLLGGLHSIDWMDRNDARGQCAVLNPKNHGQYTASVCAYLSSRALLDDLQGHFQNKLTRLIANVARVQPGQALQYLPLVDARLAFCCVLEGQFDLADSGQTAQPGDAMIATPGSDVRAVAASDPFVCIDGYFV